MPQAPSHLQAMFAHDGEAWAVLVDNFTDTAGLIRPKVGHTPTEAEMHAVDYLCLEWDYGYDSTANAPEVEAREALATRLIDAWCAAHGKQITWAKAVQITAIVTKMPDAERDRLLALE